MWKNKALFQLFEVQKSLVYFTTALKDKDFDNMRVENIQNNQYSRLNQPSFMAVDLTQPVKFSQQAIDTFVKTTKQNLTK